MAVRPSIKQIIGIKIKEDLSKDKLKAFYDSFCEEIFLSTSMSTLREVENDVHFLFDMLKDVLVQDVVYTPASSSIEVVGLKPVFHLEESSLYNHDMLWALLESKELQDNPRAIEIPYQDLSNAIGLSDKEVVQKYGLSMLNEIKFCCKDSWGRKYPYAPIYHYDKDLQFAYLFLKKLGYKLDKKDVQRYLVFEWE